MPGGTLGGSDQGEACTAFPLPKQLRKSAQLSQPRSYALRGPLWASLLLGARREARENRSSRPHGSLGHRRESRRGAECNHPTHSNPGSLLGSQVGAPAL